MSDDVCERLAHRESGTGCGLCVTGCPDEAARLGRKADDQTSWRRLD